ncbi:MAG: segregation/condensation protein A [Gammaproteobacteria bacterium]|nr:segregation/condensation protein A [Gammaproteobacteria bacterium]MYC26221.1 segregation/condensation protein A [Gammaproteobacteria bacterium]
MSTDIKSTQYLSTENTATFDQDLIPEDLYIPPDALVVILQAFTGPLDLLLYLIRRQNLDILDIPIAEVTKQYMAYIDMMTTLRLELAGDYLVMSATLAQIKSSMLLPRAHEEEEEEADPRAELVRRLLEYETFKNAAGELDQLPRLERDVFPIHATYDDRLVKVAPVPVEMRELLLAFSDILDRFRLIQDYEVSPEPLSVEERMEHILQKVRDSTDFISFGEFLGEIKNRELVVVTFLAVLELVKTGHIVLVQHKQFAPIFIGGATAAT